MIFRLSRSVGYVISLESGDSQVMHQVCAVVQSHFSMRWVDLHAKVMLKHRCWHTKTYFFAHICHMHSIPPGFDLSVTVLGNKKQTVLGAWNQNQPPNTLLKTNMAPEKTKGNNRLPTKGKLVTFQGGYIHQKTHVYVFFGGSFWGGWEPCLCLGPVSVVVSPPRELTTSRAASPG